MRLHKRGDETLAAAGEGHRGAVLAAAVVGAALASQRPVRMCVGGALSVPGPTGRTATTTASAHGPAA